MRPAEVPIRSHAALLAVLPAHVPQCTLRGLLARALPETGSKLLPSTSSIHQICVIGVTSKYAVVRSHDGGDGPSLLGSASDHPTRAEPEKC